MNELSKKDIQSTLYHDDLTHYIMQQLEVFFPDGVELKTNLYLEAVQKTFLRYIYCANHINSRYFFDGKTAVFNHLNTDNYATFLYMLSNVFYKMGESDAATRIYCLNKMLHSLDIYYEVELPTIFLLGHPIGTVLGRANYADYLVISQNCTVGNNNGLYPAFEEGVVLYDGSSVVGESLIRENTHVSVQCFIRNTNTDGNCVAFGYGNDMRMKPAKNSVKEMYFHQA